MTSPQTKSRENKVRMFKEAITVLADLLTMNKSQLDKIDSRNIKKIVDEFKSWRVV
ncbi:MAG: hypothetical protein HYT70_03640 [Candidatus Aenigmarchaeota archaeon]|nr:hypothetical protein [Candidatus Aenigmarchaeota archaeon]